jgi:hypothetical protein
MVVPAQGIGEPPVYGGRFTPLPQGHDDELVAARAADVDEVGPFEVVDQNRAALAWLAAAGLAGPGYPTGDLRLGFERSAYTLTEALGGMVGDHDEHDRLDRGQPGGAGSLRARRVIPFQGSPSLRR